MTDDRKPDASEGTPPNPAGGAAPPIPMTPGRVGGSDPNRRPDPIEDVRKGLGLLLRAAKSAIDSLPTGKVEDVMLSGAREVGRAIENVTQTLDKQFFNRDKPAGTGASTGDGTPEGASPRTPPSGVEPEKPAAKAEDGTSPAAPSAEQADKAVDKDGDKAGGPRVG